MEAVTQPQQESTGVRSDVHGRRLHWAWVMDGSSLAVTFIAVLAQAPGLGLLAMILAALGAFSGGRVIVAQGQTAWRRIAAVAAVLVALFGLYVGWGLSSISGHGIGA
jgi:hypothetical protein